MKESLIFSRQWTQADVIKELSFDKNNEEWYDRNEFEFDEEDEQKINLKEYIDIYNEFCSIFKQEELESLNNDISKIINYFYFGELVIENYINKKYRNNNSKRHSSLRYLDYLLRTQFEENISIIDNTKLINQLISEINESYYEKSNLSDLSDNTYMNKINEVFGTKKIPKFLLREGFRMRREMKKDKESIYKSIINRDDFNDIYQKDESTDNSDSESYNKLNINNKIEEKYNIKIMIKEMKNKEKLPFERQLNEIYIIIFFLALKEIKNQNIFNSIRNNFNKIIDIFKIDSNKNFNDFKREYMDIYFKDISSELISLEFGEINQSEYLSKYILASYYFLISQIFNEPNFIYINLLLFLQNFISNENKNFHKILGNEINSNLSNNKNETTNIIKNSFFLSKNNFEIPEFYNYDNIIFEESKKIHKTKYLDLFSIKNIFENINNIKLKERFFDTIKQEKSFENGSNSLRLNILNQLKISFKLKEQNIQDTIENHLKLIPYKEDIFSEGTIVILISGYFSSKSNHFDEWKELIKVYQKKFKNPIIYFFNWPSSEFKLKNLIIHKSDFKNARERGKYSGRLLAHMIISNEIFNGFKINLIGFSLGNHVIKHCIKELEKFGKLNIINNIVFIAGATEIKPKINWKKRFSLVKGMIVNFFSEIDLALKYCKNITKKETIGSKELAINEINIKNYQLDCYHLSYRPNMDILGSIFLNDLKE